MAQSRGALAGKEPWKAGKEVVAGMDRETGGRWQGESRECGLVVGAKGMGAESALQFPLGGAAPTPGQRMPALPLLQQLCLQGRPFLFLLLWGQAPNHPSEPQTPRIVGATAGANPPRPPESGRSARKSQIFFWGGVF